jgi:tetratricopeptide (TPR) repeat protein
LKSDHAGAIALYESVLARDPDHTLARYQRAMSNFDRGHYRDSFEELTQLLHKLPQDEGLRNRRALVSIQMGHFSEAIEDLSQAIILDPTFIAAYLNRARAYNLAMQWQLAIEDCNTALKIGSGGDAAIAYFRRGIAHRGKSDPEQAARDFDDAIKKDPAFPDAHAERAIVLLELERFDEAKVAIGKAISLDPNWSSYRVSLGWIEELAGDNKAALASYQQAVDLNPADPWGYEGRAWIQIITDDLKGALEDCETTISLAPQDPAAYRCRANVRMAQFDYGGAIADLTRAIVMNDSYGAAYSDRAMVNEESANYSDAIDDYSQAITLKYRTVQNLIHRGDVKRALNDRRGATRDYQRALDMDKGEYAQIITRRLARQNDEQPISERDEFNYPQPLRNKSRSSK